jgi:hypothetical protein
MRTLKSTLSSALATADKILGFVEKNGRGITVTALLGVAVFFTVFAAMNGGIVTQVTDSCGITKGTLNPITAPGLVALFLAGLLTNLDTEEKRRERLYGPRYFSRIHRL